MQTFISGSNSELCGLGGLWPCAALLDALVLKGGRAGFAVIEAVGFGGHFCNLWISVWERLKQRQPCRCSCQACKVEEREWPA